MTKLSSPSDYFCYDSSNTLCINVLDVKLQLNTVNSLDRTDRALVICYYYLMNHSFDMSSSCDVCWVYDHMIGRNYNDIAREVCEWYDKAIMQQVNSDPLSYIDYDTKWNSDGIVREYAKSLI